LLLALTTGNAALLDRPAVKVAETRDHAARLVRAMLASTNRKK
jgi:hypothetical protein